MPARLNVDREAVRVLCVAIGIREAARKLGIPPATVQAWSARGKWFAQPTLPPTVLRPLVAPAAITSATKTKSATKSLQPMQPASPGRVLQGILEDDSTATRHFLSKAARKGSETLSRAPGKVIVRHSKALKNITETAGRLHGWEEKREGGLNLNLGIAVTLGESKSAITPAITVTSQD